MITFKAYQSEKVGSVVELRSDSKVILKAYCDKDEKVVRIVLPELEDSSQIVGDLAQHFLTFKRRNEDGK